MANGKTGGPGGIERRASPRKATRLAVRFSTPGQLKKALAANTNDFSLGGLCLLTPKALDPGTELRLGIELDDGGGTLEIDAVVAWCKPGRAVGLRFLELRPDQRSRLLALLGEKLP